MEELSSAEEIDCEEFDEMVGEIEVVHNSRPISAFGHRNDDSATPRLEVDTQRSLFSTQYDDEEEDSFFTDRRPVTSMGHRNRPKTATPRSARLLSARSTTSEIEVITNTRPVSVFGHRNHEDQTTARLDSYRSDMSDNSDGQAWSYTPDLPYNYDEDGVILLDETTPRSSNNQSILSSRSQSSISLNRPKLKRPKRCRDGSDIEVQKSNTADTNYALYHKGFHRPSTFVIARHPLTTRHFGENGINMGAVSNSSKSRLPASFRPQFRYGKQAVLVPKEGKRGTAYKHFPTPPVFPCKPKSKDASVDCQILEWHEKRDVGCQAVTKMKEKQMQFSPENKNTGTQYPRVRQKDVALDPMDIKYVSKGIQNVPEMKDEMQETTVTVIQYPDPVVDISKKYVHQTPSVSQTSIGSQTSFGEWPAKTPISTQNKEETNLQINQDNIRRQETSSSNETEAVQEVTTAIIHSANRENSSLNLNTAQKIQNLETNSDEESEKDDDNSKQKAREKDPESGSSSEDETEKEERNQIKDERNEGASENDMNDEIDNNNCADKTKVKEKFAEFYISSNSTESDGHTGGYSCEEKNLGTHRTGEDSTEVINGIEETDKPKRVTNHLNHVAFSETVEVYQSISNDEDESDLEGCGGIKSLHKLTLNDQKIDTKIM